MDIILLENIQIYAFHGCLREERRIGGHYRVDLEIEMDLRKAAQSDELVDTIDYNVFYEIVIQQMQIPSRLIENVAHRILECLFQNCVSIESAKVKLCKINPPMEGEIKRVCVFMKKKKFLCEND